MDQGISNFPMSVIEQVLSSILNVFRNLYDIAANIDMGYVMLDSYLYSFSIITIITIHTKKDSSRKEYN